MPRPAEAGPTRSGAWGALLAWRARRPVLSLLALAALVRVFVLGAAALGGTFVTRYAGEGAWTKDTWVWLRHLARWDSGYYLGIAERGRGYQPESWAFDPGYPLAVRALWRGVPGFDEMDAGFVVGLAALAASVPLIYHLTKAWFGEAHAWRATALFTLLPASFYSSAMYPDGLFTALVLAFFLALARRSWLLTGAAASLAAVTRPQGLLLPGVLLLALALERARGRPVPPSALLALPLAAALPAWDMLHAWQATGDWLHPHHARGALWPHVRLRNPLGTFTWPYWPIQRGFVYGALALLLASLAWAARDAWRRRLGAPLEVHAFCFAQGALILAYSDPAASVRYLLPVLAVPWALAAWAGTRARFALVALLSLAALAAVAALFAAWYPLY